MQLALVARKRALAAEATGIAHAVDGPLVPAFHAALPFPLTDDQAARHRADHRRHGAARRRCTGCSRARSARARPSSRSPRCSSPCRAATRARSWRPTEVLAEQHELTMRALLGELIVPRRGHAARRAAGAASRCSPTARPAAERRRIADGLLAGDGRHPRRHPRADLRRRRVRPPRRRGDRRAAPLRRRAARPAAGEGRLARRAGDDGDADPAHRRDAHLRRPRQDRAARAARRGVRRSTTDGGRRRPAGAGGGVRAGARRGRGGPAGLRGVPARRGVRQARGAGRHRGARAAARRGARRAAPRPAARPDAGGRQGGGDARVPRRRDRRARGDDRHRGRASTSPTRP